jgi:hypothetical protein
LISLKKVQAIKISQVNLKQLDQKKWKQDKPVTKQQVVSTAPKITMDNPQIDLKPVIDFSPEDILFLALQIESNKKNHCPIVIGLARELQASKTYSGDAKLDGIVTFLDVK